MPLSKSGKNILKAEVQSITAHGIWLWVGGREYFLSYKDFPWFKQGTVSAICNVELPTPWHLYWPDLDVDLHLDSLENLEQYPLIAK